MFRNLLIFVFLLVIIFSVTLYATRPRTPEPVLLYHHAHSVSVLGLKLNFFEPEVWLLKLKGFTFRSMRQYVPGNSKTVFLSFDDANSDFYTDVYPVLKKHKIPATLYVPYAYLDKPGYITRSQLKEMVLSGFVEIGSHGINHVPLLNVSADTLGTEVIDSKLLLEKDAGTKVTSFSYPYGYFTAELMTMVERAGYTSAVLGDNKSPAQFKNEDELYLIKRVPATLGALIQL